jgi:chemotaxis protein MotA
MEMTTVLGLIIGIGGILLGNIIEGGHVSSLAQGAAAVIVFGGTFGAVLVSSKRKDLKVGYELLKASFVKERDGEAQQVLSEIIECAKIARKDSILAIEPRIPQIKNQFLQSVIRSVVDGVDPVVVREIYEKQIDLDEDKKTSGSKVWMDAGGFAPTVGIIGAVLGLIHVMGNLTDTSKLGSGIAVAFVATIYGVGSANLIFLPIAGKIKKIIASEVKLQEMILEGGICILSGLSPSLIDIKLRSFIEKGDS